MPNGPLLDLRHLQMIQALARLGRVTDAAEVLGVTPSALSHRVREAERRLGVILFTRVHKRLRLTPAAEYLADVAERLLSELDRAERDVQRMDRGVAHVVRIAVEAYSSYHWLPGFTAHLQSAVPNVDLQVMAGFGRDPGQALVNREVDLIITSAQSGLSGTLGLPLFSDPLLFIMPPTHRLARQEYVEGADIEGEDFITYAKTPAPDREFAKLFRPSGRYPRWTVTVELPEAIVELVAAGQGTSVLAGWAVRPAIDAGRIASAQVGATGIDVQWRVVFREEDAGGSAIEKTAQSLARWAAENNGFG